MAAAARSAECGLRVGIVDENRALGGQIWREETQSGRDVECGKWMDRAQSAGARLLCGLRVFDQPEAGQLTAEDADGVRELRYGKLILATGARERFLPFPGWTLLNVMGAGGLQAMVKCGLPIAGKRVVVAGTGPLLLAVAAYLRGKGAVIPVVCEQAPRRALAGLGASLLRNPAKLAQALQLRRELGGVRLAMSSWVVAAEGREQLQSVTILCKGRRETIACDYLACGLHLVPNIELPLLLGCQARDGCVVVDEFQRTSVADVYCGGEATGIGGVELSLTEGEIAGLAAAGRVENTRELFGRRSRMRRFARALERTFQLRQELRSLASPETIVCRCEDVAYSRLSGIPSWRAAKLQTRCGMGACQGRVCGAAVKFLFDWNPDSVRPPIFPVRIASLAISANGAKSRENDMKGVPR